jgi:hypothetical protein
MSSVSIPGYSASRGATQTGERAQSLSRAVVPWYIWCAVAAVTSAQVGAHWDISWHQAIGRDTFWTPAHLAIHACGVLSGIAFGYIILSTTFNRDAPLRESSVHILGLRAPIGAFIASWGGIAMLTSAPFDNWWHDAYGLDVKIVSPPHIVLFIGVYAILVGTLILIAGHMNRVTGAARHLTRWLYLYSTGILLVGVMVLLMEFVNKIELHNALPYIVMSLLVPMVLASVSRVTRFRFAATGTALFYSLFVIGCILILQKFPAEPKLGPVYQHVTHFITPQFPILLVVPALLLDLFWHANRPRSIWYTSVISAVIFVASLVAVEWPFAGFLLSPASHNAFFGDGSLAYFISPHALIALGRFNLTDTPAQFILGLLLAVLFATLTFRFGFRRGDWVSEVKR